MKTVVTSAVLISAALAATAAASPAPHAVQAMVLDAHGLIITVPGDAAARRIRFGTPQTVAIAALGKVLGRADVTREPEECNMGPSAMHADYRNGLQLQFRHGRLIGWRIEQASTLRTADGIGLGTPRATLVRLHPRVIFEDTDTLGYRFSVPGGIDGGLTNSSPTARVNFLSAGGHCVIS